ncbi:DUF4239-containing protein [Aureococcus anophagefferens]|nr:DUF4239-containing protein [Aureococcus anophagefferens]
MPAKIAVPPIALDEEGIPSPRTLLTTPLFSVRSRRLSEAERSPKGRRPSVSVSVRRGPKTHAFPPASPAATTEGGFFAALASPPSSPRIQIVVQRAHHATHIDIDVFLWLKLVVVASLLVSASGLVPARARGSASPPHRGDDGDAASSYQEAATLRDFDEPPRLGRLYTASAASALEPLMDWQSNAFRGAAVAAAYVSYAPIASALAALPSPNAAEGGYFFSLMSIVYGTLTASTISDSTTRLSNLRAAAVEEVTSLPAVTRRLESMLLGRHATLEMGRVFEDVAAGVLAHTDALIGGSTAEELASISDSRDPLLDVVAVLEDAQHELGLDLGFALDGVERAIAARGKRLSLERSSIAPEQFAVLSGLAVALVGAYVRTRWTTTAGRRRCSGSRSTAASTRPSASTLFSLVVGAVSVFGNLAEDLNRPFTANKLESDTVVASLKQLRDGLLPHIRRG